MALVIVRRIVRPGIRTVLLFTVRARIRSMPADAGADHADMNVISGSKYTLEPRRTNSFGCGGPNGSHHAFGIDTRRIGQALKQCRNGLGQKELLLGHTARIVDGNDQVDSLGLARASPAPRTTSSGTAGRAEDQRRFGFTTDDGRQNGRAENADSSVTFHARIEPIYRAAVKSRTTSDEDEVDVRPAARYPARRTSAPLRYGSDRGFGSACFE